MFTMKHIFLTLLATLVSVFAQAQASVAQTATRKPVQRKVILRNVGLARVSVSKGALRRTIDLSEEIAGCAHVSGQYRVKLTKRGCAAPPATFKLIDSTTQNGNTYLIVLSNAMDNCNVCGRCGASEASSLIWLELDPKLQVLKKNSVPIQDCVAFIGLVRTSSELSDTDTLEDLEVRFKGDNLFVEIKKEKFEESGDRRVFQYTHLEYSRKEPEKGFTITTDRTRRGTGQTP